MSKSSDDRVLMVLLCSLASTAALVLILILYFTAAEALPGLRKIGLIAFLTSARCLRLWVRC
jgi:ABC-type phosphate transport system permease subunit